MDIDLRGQRAFVTAGGAGIGRAIVLALRDAGASVATCDIDAATLADLPEDVDGALCDVSDPVAVDTVLSPVVDRGIDILVNNAGVAGPTKLVEDITDHEWRSTMAVDIDSFFYCARRVVPVFKRQRSGLIVNLTSTAGLYGYPTRSPYVAAKWAVNGFTKSLAMELGPDNIRVNAIAPGSVNGPRIDGVISRHAEAEGLPEQEVRRLYALGVSMHTFVDAEEIASMICYLASHHGRHISGQIIGIDGHTETLWPRA